MLTFSSLQFYQKKKDFLLYKACDTSRHYILKCTDSSELAVQQALHDEYEALSALSHPCIPAYYGFLKNLVLPDRPGHFSALCMEDRLFSSSVPFSSLSLTEMIHILLQTAETLSFLLQKGILYTDLNLSNLLVHRKEEKVYLSLVDYTYCYYFLANPHPLYPLRFSYDLSLQLDGQQLLIQELSLLLQEMLDSQPALPVSSDVYRLLETGKNPPSGLLLSDFSVMIRQILI